MLRLSDLVDCDVVDQTGKSWGHVHDVRLVEDGPLLSSNFAAFRLHGLACGKRALAARIGLRSGPPIYVPWNAVRSIEGEVIRVEAPPDGFRPR
jgi:sporulation protein YlmC with PRC-barrel domain